MGSSAEPDESGIARTIPESIPGRTLLVFPGLDKSGKYLTYARLVRYSPEAIPRTILRTLTLTLSRGYADLGTLTLG